MKAIHERLAKVTGGGPTPAGAPRLGEEAASWRRYAEAVAKALRAGGSPA